MSKIGNRQLAILAKCDAVNASIAIQKVIDNKITGGVKYFFGKRFIYSDGHWSLDEISHNVISEKNKGLKGYRIHSYSL